jgi:hypothetical protein
MTPRGASIPMHPTVVRRIHPSTPRSPLDPRRELSAQYPRIGEWFNSLRVSSLRTWEWGVSGHRNAVTIVASWVIVAMAAACRRA